MSQKHLWAGRSLALVLLALALPGCAARASAPVGEPVADPAPLLAELRSRTVPAAPRQATFAWRLNEQGSRLQGRGVVRYQAPERLRLDLFGPRGETYLSAALVGEEFRVPPAVTERIALPSPALLWAALGVFRPTASSELVSATAADSVTVLRYRSGDDVYEFRAREAGDGLRLQRVERNRGSSVLESVRLEYGPAGDLARTRYRDWSAYRDLELDMENVNDATSFPESIWRPGAEGR